MVTIIFTFPSIEMNIMTKNMKSQISFEWKISKDAMTLVLPPGEFREIIGECVVRKPGEQKGIVLRALWDTGCTNTHIAQRVADVLGLEPCGVGRSVSVDHYSVDKAYKADIIFPIKKGISNHRVYTCPLPEIDVLIGLDIIKICDFAISCNADGNVVCSIRMPSRGATDYTDD